jgi:hypothetical protein
MQILQAEVYVIRVQYIQQITKLTSKMRREKGVGTKGKGQISQ